MGASGLQQLLRNSQKRGTNWFVFLLVGVCLMLASAVSDAQLTANCSVTQTISCNGGVGEITVSASGGVGNYQYSIDGGTNWVSNNVFSGLAANSYTISVRDEDAPPVNVSCTADLTEPGVLSFSVSGSYACSAGAGSLDVSVAGGTPNYTVAVAGPTTPPDQVAAGPDFTFSGLNGGSYTIAVSDANGCVAPAAPPHVILVDASAPAIASSPDPYETDYASFISGSLVADIPISGPTAFQITSTYNEDRGPFDLFNYTNARYSFNVAQSGVAPTPADIIRVLESTDGGTTFPTVLAERTSAGSGTISGSITLNSNPTLNRNVVIRIEVTITTSGLIYDFSDYLILADQRVNTGAFLFGQPGYSDDLSGVASISFSDDEVSWNCFTPGNEELVFSRNWRATDNCLKVSGYTSQVVRVGTAPTFGAFPAALTFDFCHNTGIAITAPVVSDNCTAVGNLVLEWRVFDSFGDPVSDWNSFASVTTYDFSPAPEGQNFQIGWRVTDEAGFSTESVTTQLISFRPEITISLVTTASPGNYDVCEGDNATFLLRGTGGTGGYNIISIDPSPTQALPITFSEGADATFTYNTTDHQLTAGSSIVVTFQDRDYGSPTVIGGCPASEGTATFTSGGGVYTVHQKISTSGIGRD